MLGRSLIVGKPLALLLMQKGVDATVTVVHSRTRNLAEITRSADIIVAAIGQPRFVRAEHVREGAMVIDVGINRVDDASAPRGYRLVGDVAFEEVAPKTDAITPVPGGVGPMTIAMLMANTVKAAQFANLDPGFAAASPLGGRVRASTFSRPHDFGRKKPSTRFSLGKTRKQRVVRRGCSTA